MKKREQGILTVEASIVLTFILLAILFLFGFGRVYRAQSLVSHAVIQAADAVALESYLRETALQGDAASVARLANEIASSGSISSQDLESLRSANLPSIAKKKFALAIETSEGRADEKLKNAGIKGGISGIDFSECKMDLKNDDVIIAISYTLEMQFPLFGANEIPMTKTAKAKTFGEILFEVTTAPNNPSWGSTSGDTKVTHGSNVQITATPNYGYVFKEWSDGSKEPTRIVTVTDAQKYVAIFEKDKFGINLSVNNANYGSTSGSGTYEYQTVVPIKATPKEHYQFVGWDDNNDGTVDNTNSTRNITVDKTYNLKAIFKPVQYTITVKSNNTTFGKVNVSQGSTTSGSSIKADYGSKVNINAVLNNTSTYRFINWSNGSTNASTTITVKGNETFTANFDYNTYTVTFYNGNTKVASSPVIRGSSISTSGSVGAKWPSDPKKNGASFGGWTYNGSSFSNSTKVTGNINVYAKWNCTVSLNPGKGSVSWTSKKIGCGDSVKLPKPSLANHTFTGWVGSDGKTYKADTSYSFSSNITLTATYSCNKTVGTVIETYRPYCRDIYANGSLIPGRSEGYNKYRCTVCGTEWKVDTHSVVKHYRMDNKNGYTNDDFSTSCSVKHADTHYGFCGKYYSTTSGNSHTWDGYYHILCNYCYKEEQGEVYGYVNGVLQLYNFHRCAKHNTKGTHGCPF